MMKVEVSGGRDGAKETVVKVELDETVSKAELKEEVACEGNGRGRSQWHGISTEVAEPTLRVPQPTVVVSSPAEAKPMIHRVRCQQFGFGAQGRVEVPMGEPVEEVELNAG
ncbi:hypothetical protein E2562_029314 [Oryza meyeriana var. granulata]|uniref:Uncharacterized protein n=1 Tax=Oryza meyeriana var. granulata TaxID=110450 RepID=A0A6G1E3S2_9ORYZ|nr:hypothetical protein E2562_029314 [Oryza meyeriana var. granulata]